MASSSLIRRLAVSLIASLGVATLTISLAPAASAEPTVAEVTAQISALSKKNEQLTELYNKASEDVKAKQSQATAAKGIASKARTDYTVAQNQLRATLAEQFKAAGFSRTGALLTSSSQQNYLDQLSTLQLLSARRAALSNKMKAAKETAATAQATSDKLLADATAKQKALADQRTALAADQDKYSKLLNKLTAEQRDTYFATTNPTATAAAKQIAITNLPVAAPSGAAAVAVQYALAQQGKPYVYAASGPNAFDCSGLTAAAWQAAGLRIPHVAASQYNIGTHVSRDQLQPGDLVFFYHPIGHVGMYIGNGLIVHAPTSGDVVKVVPLSTFNGDYVGATRL